MSEFLLNKTLFKGNKMSKKTKIIRATGEKKKRKKTISQPAYSALFSEVKDKIQQAQNRAFLSITREMILLYWEIGQLIVDRQNKQGWGAKVIEKLSSDLRKEIPDSRSFSVRNLKYMLKFYKTYLGYTALQKSIIQVPWSHNIVIMDKVKSFEEREYYIKECLGNGWSRNVLVYQIESNLYERDNETKKQNNFKETLPKSLSSKAQKIFKDEFNLEFLGVQKTLQERELEGQMLRQIRDVLLEFGQGFAFVGNQYRVQVEEDEYFIDLLFFHRELQCLIACELKIDRFIPEYAGKMNFYLNILDNFVKFPHENPTIGIIFCRSKNRTTVEFAVKGIEKPMGVAQYYLTKKLPEDLKGKLPSAGQIEKKIKGIEKTQFQSSRKLEKRYSGLLKLLSKREKVSPSDLDLQKATGYSHSRLSRILNELSKEGYLFKEKKGRLTLYSIQKKNC